MKRIWVIIITIMLLCGCSQNNGHIGPIHGAWTLLEMTVDGTSMALAGDYTVFSFQGEIVQITHMLRSPDDYTKNFGNFSLNAKELTLQFEAGLSGDEGYQYTAPAWLDFPADGRPICIEITELNTRTMAWQRVDNQGTIYQYKFKKTW